MTIKNKNPYLFCLLLSLSLSVLLYQAAFAFCQWKTNSNKYVQKKKGGSTFVLLVVCISMDVSELNRGP